MVGASPCLEMVNSAPRDELSIVPAVTFHLSKADDPEVKSVLNSHSDRPVSSGQLSANEYSQCRGLKHFQVEKRHTRQRVAGGVSLGDTKLGHD